MPDNSLDLVKNKLLAVAASGVYLNFTPARLQENHDVLTQFLEVNSGSIDTVELFNLYELQFYLSLMTNHDVEAKAYLDRLIDQFGSAKSQRIKLLQSIYLEAMGDNLSAMKILGQSADEVRLSRRLVTFSRKPNNNEDYIASLNYYLDLQPSDLITWAELAEEYKKIGHYEKGIHCLQEILLQEPFAYNIFYEVGLYYYYSFLQDYGNKAPEKKDKLLELMATLANSRNNYLRSIEMCDSYKKSWVGIYLIIESKFNDLLQTKLKDNKYVVAYLDENSSLKSLAKRKIIELNNLKDDEELSKFLNIHK